jgi:hypothetical protein
VIHIRIIGALRGNIANLFAVVEVSHAAIESPFHFNSHWLIENFSTRGYEANGSEGCTCFGETLCEKIEGSWSSRDKVRVIVRE